MKKFINILAVVVIVVFAGYNVMKAQQTEVVSDVVMANVEALAQNEGGSDMCSSFYGYAVSRKFDGQSQVWIHYGYGLDRVVTYSETGCIASGKGTLWGTPDFYMEVPTTNLVPCTGLCGNSQ